jgi:hypothetical protein
MIGMAINMEKSFSIFHQCLDEEIEILPNIIPSPKKTLDEGFKYLCFFLGPDCYKNED